MMATKMKLFRWAFFLLGMVAYVACTESSEENAPTPVGTKNLQVSPNKLAFPASGGTQQLRVSTNYDYYGFNIPVDWLYGDFIDDATYNYITITAEPNTSTSVRTATIRITGSEDGENINESVNVTVEQEGGSASEEGSSYIVPVQGGMINEGDISIQFPEHAFNVETEVVVEPVNYGETVGGQEISGFYKVTLPLSSGQPLKVSIKSNETGEDVVLIAHAPVASTHDVLQNTIYSDIVLPSAYSNGTYSAEIPTFDNEGETGTVDVTFGLARLQNKSSARVSNKTRAVEDGDINWNMEWWERADDPNRNKIQTDIDEAIRDAVRIIKGLGFKVKNHRIVPIIITTKGLGVDEYGQHEQSCVSDNWNSIKLNASLLFGSSYKKKLLRQTMIHEMFHYFQSAYDSRGCFRKAKFGNKTILRLMETGGVWIEKFMDDDKMYDYKWDSNFQAVMTAVLKEGAGENGGSEMQNAQAWGYGSALILEWFAKNNGDATILKLYEAWRDKGASSFENWIKNGETATGTKFFDRFDDFVSLLAEGKLIGGLENSGTGDRYPYTVAYFNINNRINITSDGTVNANSQVYQYGVSSARVQLFNYEKSTDNKDMKLTITQKGDGVITKSYLYNVSRRTVVPLNLVYSGKPLVISEESTLRDLLNKDNGYVLYLVTQCASNYNETESSEIEISMEEQDVSIIGSWDYTVDHESKGRYTRSFTWGFSYDGSYSYTEKVDSWANSNKTEWDWGWNTRYETGTYSISGNMLNLSPTKNTLWDENDMNHNNPMSGTTSAYSLKFSVSSDGKSLTIDDKTYKKQ